MKKKSQKKKRKENHPAPDFRELISEIPNLIRVQHVPPVEINKLITIVQKYPTVFQWEQNTLMATNVLKH